MNSYEEINSNHEVIPSYNSNSQIREFLHHNFQAADDLGFKEVVWLLLDWTLYLELYNILECLDN